MVIHAEPVSRNFYGVWPSRASELNSVNSELKSSIAQRKVPTGHTKFFQAIKAQRRLHAKLLKVSLFTLITGAVASQLPIRRSRSPSTDQSRAGYSLERNTSRNDVTIHAGP